MQLKEATARIKINKLLESAGWLFFADGDKPANIRLEAGVTLKKPLRHPFQRESALLLG